MSTPNTNEVLSYIETLMQRFNPLDINIAITALCGHFHSFSKYMEGVIHELSKGGLISLKNGVITINHHGYVSRET